MRWKSKGTPRYQGCCYSLLFRCPIALRALQFSFSVLFFQVSVHHGRILLLVRVVFVVLVQCFGLLVFCHYSIPQSPPTHRSSTLIDLPSQPHCVCFSTSQAPTDSLQAACYKSIAAHLLHLANPVPCSYQVREIREALPYPCACFLVKELSSNPNSEALP